MSKNKIPATDSIEQLAHFWDNNDITDFEDELEEVKEPVFERETVLKINLQAHELEVIKKLAASQGLSCNQLIHQWIVQHIQTS
jgi:predicted DNA binding CopG/RHH family protein